MIAGIYSFGTDVTASGGTASAGTASTADYYVAGITAEAIAAWDTVEREAWIRENRMILFMRLGAVLGSGRIVKYWRISKSQFNFDFNKTLLLSLSGFV